ncbi:esterase E4-like [Planococcus citri]|uniref:esterase E4-like n=1 Tax=Planococcus citri TaxID=170843 RepID=UPI0031F996B3
MKDVNCSQFLEFLRENKMLYYVLFVLIGIAGDVASNESEAPRTKIKQGEIIGTTYLTYSGRKVWGFYGLPFAAPPVKERRFEPPYPPEPWDKPKIATNKSDFCVQLEFAAPAVSTGNEDCLYLDVYTPKVPKDGKCDKLLPVLVHFHSSSAFFFSGTPQEAYYLLDKHDAVFVTINYRLGIFGYLTTGDDVVPGNNAFKDQVMSLKWVQENIRSFCGDPNLVTAEGISEGAKGASLLMLSPLGKGLFHRVIASSFNSFTIIAFHAEGKELAKTVANQLNCPTKNSKEMVECLKLKNSYIFFDLELQFRKLFILPLEVYGSTIEICHKGALLSKTPIKALADGDLAQNVPILHIETEYEGNILAYFMAVPGLMEVMDLTYRKNLKYMLDFYHTMPPHLFKNTSEAIKQEYFGDGLMSLNERGFKSMVTDALISEGSYTQWLQFAKHSNMPVYNFRDCYRGVFSTSIFLSLVQSNKDYGASHTDASLYVIFDSAFDKKIRLSKKDKAMVDFMTELYYSFMVDGKPSVADKLGWLPQPKTGDEAYYLQFENPYRMYLKKNDNYGNRKFWHSLPIQKYYGFPDDFCELESTKTASTNNGRDKNNENKKPELKQDEKEKEQYDQQVSCDRNQEEKMQRLHNQEKWQNHHSKEDELHQQ